LIGQHVSVLHDLTPKENERFVREIIEHLQRKGIWSGEVKNRTKAGISFLTYARLSTLELPEKKLFISVQEDITVRKHLEEATVGYVKFIRLLLETIPNPIFYKDFQGIILGCNKAFANHAGVPQQEILGKTVYDLFPGEVARQCDEMDQKALQYPETRVYINLDVPAPDGNPRQMVCHKAALVETSGSPGVVVSILTDITDLKRAEEGVRESEARLRAIFEHAPVGITMVDSTGRFLRTNPAFQKIVGYSATELQSMTWQQLTPPEDLPRNLRLQEELIARQRQYYTIEKRLRRKNGEIVFVNVMLSRLENAQGEPQVIGTIIDISARKLAEEALRESEQRFRLMAETIQDAFWIGTAAFDKILYMSPGYERIWGRPGAELCASPQAFMESIHPEDYQRVKDKVTATTVQAAAWDHEYRIIKAAGEVRWIQDRGFPVRGEQGQIILYTGVATDITERKVLEQQLLLAQKMEAVGRLAGGVAHDFNNILMAIMGYGELIRTKVPRGDPLYDYLENILKATDRAAALTGQLLTFSRRQIVHPQAIDLNRVVLDLERMLRRLIEEDIDLKIITAPGIGNVMADPGYLNQIILNLVINARDAMPCGGRIILQTAPVDLGESRQTRSGLAPPGPYVRLEVRDNGIGIDESIQAQIFEPFFTTKEPSKGTGLGLSTVYGIIKQSGGFIDLDSKPGEGSTFTIYLPRQEVVEEPLNQELPVVAKFQGEETILLVEDEDVLRALLAKFLRLFGYTVLEARHGVEALLTCERHQGPIHMMVTDVVMPQMSGRQLADRLTPLRPEMKVLYMSGYTEDEVVQRGVADLSVAFLQKPFKPVELARQVHAALHPAVHR
jgi:two-component system cell cycle sensor histidine kinase/response regulator CckA